MDVPLRAEESPKKTPAKRRGSYSKACDECNRRKGKCDGSRPICKKCDFAGRECTWVKTDSRLHKGAQLLESNRKLAANLRKLLVEYYRYAIHLETQLDQCPQNLHSRNNFRASRPIDPVDLVGSSIRLENMDLAFALMDQEIAEESDESDDPTKEIRLPTQRLMIGEGGTIHHYGITAPFLFNKFSPQPSRFPAIIKDPLAIYILVVDDVSEKHFNPHFEWSRFLPSEVPLDRRSHDKALDLLFKFCTSFYMRIVPPLFLRDMCHVLLAPPSQERPKTAHYSPMLHNALVGLALAFLDDPKFRDLKTRLYFIDKAKSYLEVECQQPDISVVQALSLLGSFYGSQGEQGLGFIYFGLSTRVAQALGLNIDCSDWVKLGKIGEPDRIDRNWANWTTFANDVCWSLYVGRPFGILLPDANFPMPYVDVELDQMAWVHGPSNLPAQPNYLTKTFEATCELFTIARCIMDVMDHLNKTKARPRLIQDQIYDVDTRFNKWRNSLPSQLDITPESRSTATPHKLSLHLSYHWLLILLHRPFFHQKTRSINTGRDIDHINICQVAAENIMSLFATWQKLYELRYCPITLMQIAFSAGTVYLLSAMQACSGGHVVQKDLRYALDQHKTLLQHLQQIGRSWPGATKMSEILVRLMEDHLIPLLERDEKGEGPTSCDPSTSSRIPGQIRGRTSTRKSRCPTILKIPKASSSISVTEDSTSRTFTRSPTSGETFPLSPSASLAKPSSIPIAIPPKSTCFGSSNPSGFVNVSPGNTIPDPGASSEKFDAISPSYDWANFHSPPHHHHHVSDIAGSGSGSQPVGSSNSLEQLEDLQATGSSSAVPFLSGSPYDSFVGPPDGHMTYAPFWSQFSVGDYSTAPLAIYMDDAVHTVAPPRTTQEPASNNAIDSRSSERVDTKDSHMEDLTAWIDLTFHKPASL